MEPGDGFDNDCDGAFDEEIQDGLDNDGDGRVDEDLEKVIYLISKLVNELFLLSHNFLSLQLVQWKKLSVQCFLSFGVDGDKKDNDCDGQIDEEKRDRQDNDGDGLIDEDTVEVN